jgi:hypothetical protein
MKIEEVKKNLNKIVGYNGGKYKLTACILRASETGCFYQAEILDMKCENSVLICKLEEVEVIS